MPANEKRQPAAKERGVAKAVEPVRVGKQDGWRITYDGHHKTVVASPSSMAAIREAFDLYGDAMKRLAKR